MFLVSGRIAKKLEEVSKHTCVPLERYDKLDVPVADHADMLFFILEDKIFCYEDYVNVNEALKNVLLKSNYDIVFVSNRCESTYPLDISLNVLLIGKKLFCNVNHTAKEILLFAEEREYEIINVRQGYSACSTLVVNENTAITGDKGMYDALKSNGVNALLTTIKIELCGYDCGFIGGASVVTCDSVIFFGEPSNLVDFDDIVNFIHSAEKEVKYISLDGVYDFGGAKLII